MSAIDQDFVRDLIERHSDASGGNGRDFHNGAYAAIADEMAQAIAATLGESPRLPYWWTHDGALHIELPKLPESISVRLPDQRDREVGSTRTWQFTRDSGTCHECAGMDDVFECSACGGRYEGWALKRWARYCPDCGKRVVTHG